MREIFEGSYTSPGGDYVTFKFEDLETSFKRNGTAFTFPNANDTYVQDVSTTGLSMPMVAIFTNHARAEKFVEYLRIPGLGKLMHPVKGLRYVMPLGEVKQKDALVSNINETQVKVTFVETVLGAYAEEEAPKSEAIEAIKQFDLAIEWTLDPGKLPGVGAIKSVLSSVRGVTKKIANVETQVSRAMDSITRGINYAMSTVIGDPIALFFQATQLIRKPAMILGLTMDKLEAYWNVIEQTSTNLFSSSQDKAFASSQDKAFASGLVLNASAASVEAVLIADDFVSAAEAIGAAERVLAIFDQATTFAEANGGLSQAWGHLSRSVNITVGYLVRLSFTLLQEREYTAPRDMTLLEAVAEVYGAENVEKNLDFLIESNYLNGSEILTIPKGKVLKVYE